MNGHQSPTIADPGDGTTDAASPVQLGRRAFIAGTAGAVAGATLLSGTADAVEPGASYFEVVDQRRLCDTRARPGMPAGFGYEWLGGRWIRVGITSQPGVPADAVAAVLTVTAVSRGAGWNYVTVFPAGEPMPDTSSLNLSSVRRRRCEPRHHQARSRRSRPVVVRRL